MHIEVVHVSEEVGEGYVLAQGVSTKERGSWFWGGKHFLTKIIYLAQSYLPLPFGESGLDETSNLSVKIRILSFKIPENTYLTKCRDGLSTSIGTASPEHRERIAGIRANT
ncbi:hypothetical protein GCM10023184_33660 [Flaviaesturariibacter amylovorans]|uniref:Uncharacterized protein n=1 Tax=Flaviaesturariibacter amylovorans TaxID=1084520 RepID=A0ABP8HD30_9BACT